MMAMKTNCGGFGDVCEIFYYNQDDFDVGIILKKEDNMIVYKDFNMFGEYNGLILQTHRVIEEICYDDRYVRFMKKIIDRDTISSLELLNKMDFINYAIKNNRVLAIVTKKQEVEDFNDVKIIDCDGTYLKYQIYTRWAELYKRIHKTKISDIVMMQVDSKYTRLIEKIREE